MITLRTLTLGCMTLVGGGLGASGLYGQQYDEAYDDPAYTDASWEAAAPAIEARVWLDRGRDAYVAQGERARVYYRTDRDAYVAVFQIDTDGFVRLVFPESPLQNHWVRGGRDYRLLFPHSPYWTVDDAPGVGYFFILASAEPFEFDAIPYSTFSDSWDLTRVGSEVRSDPFLAMDDYVERMVPYWEYGEYGLDYTEYSVGGGHDYPRFLCYDCHGYRPYAAWNPYAYTCTTFSVVVWDDPFYYPTRRIRGDRVVFVGRRPGTRPRFEFKERARGEGAGGVVTLRREGPQRTAVRRTSGGVAPRARPSDPSVVRDGDRVRRGTAVVAPPRRGDAGSGGAVGRPSVTRTGPGGVRTDPGVQPTRGRPGDRDARGRDAGTVTTRRPPAASPERPRLERRPPAASRRGGDAGTRGATTRGEAGARPSRTRSDQGSSGARPGVTRRPGAGSGSTSVRRGPAASSRRGGGAQTRARPSSGATRSRPSTVNRPRSGTGQATSRPPARSGGARANPATRSRPSSTRPTTSRPTTSRPTTSRPATSRPARVRSAPVRGNPGSAQARPTRRPSRAAPQRSGTSSRARPRPKRKPGG